MRKSSLALCAGLLSATILGAQQPAPDPIDQVLNKWEGAMMNLSSFTAQVNRTAIDKAFQTTEVWSGEAKFLKGQTGTASRASLYLRKVMNPPPAPTVEVPFEKFVCTGNFLYQYAQASKEIIVHKMPENQGGQIADDNIIAFLFGRRVATAKQRYEMTLVKAPMEQEKFYRFITIKPRQEADKQDFNEARLVLWADSGYPRQFWFRQPNGNEVSWDFPAVVPNAVIAPQEFAAPSAPPGWKVTQAPTQQTKVRN